MLRFLGFLASFVFLMAILAAGGVLALFWHYGRDLPDYHQLAHYEPPVTTRVYAGDGRLVAEYAVEKRSFVPLEAMPKLVVRAFLSAEDKSYFSHPGIDFMGIGRAMLTNMRNVAEDKRLVGASTITQQVAKNFLLTNERSFERKIKEMILAFRIEKTFTKEHILELYLNEIYLGMGSYGVAAAAVNYFDKGLDHLGIAEAAYLAALPKAPNNYNPLKNYAAAKERRDWVIGRMAEDGYIGVAEAEAAKNEPLSLRRRPETELVTSGDYFAEDIRRDLAARYGESALYRGGLLVRSTLDPKLQGLAGQALRRGLLDYDRRHGWRGPLTRLTAGPGWPAQLAAVPMPQGVPEWRLALVLSVSDTAAEIGLVGGTLGRIPFEEMKWARPALEDQRFGPPPKRPGDVVKAGDVVLVEPVKEPDGVYGLRQAPKVEGALVAVDPHTGRVLAMVGGFAFARSEFNRATQALRQPGSAFKPFVYLAALDNGYTPSSLVLDGPIVLEQGPGLPKWKPSNYSGDFLGPTTLRVGIEKSRNLMTVRLAQAVGMETISDYAAKFGIMHHLPKVLSMALGAGETTVLRLTTAYAMLVNGGKKIEPTLIDRIQDRHGKTIYRHDQRPCSGCSATFFTNQEMPPLPDNREQLTDPMSAHQMVSILQGVVQRGTGRRVAALGRPLAGKTGTSNDSFDTWFVGFSPDLAVGVFVGFDEPRTLGDKETGGSVAVPIFKDFMEVALADRPATPFRVPRGIRLVRVNGHNGQPAQPGDPDVILEAFKPGTVPTGEFHVLDGGDMDGWVAPEGMYPPAPTEGGLTTTAAPQTPGMPSAPEPPAAGIPVPAAGGLY
ncbi:MAG: penicillin-binding protein 1A [Alphaproteobacteria bacterium]|nr:penicillin-binding protein 1A [Alphaproteobacteria bacterium]